jgi:hypothetical protein
MNYFLNIGGSRPARPLVWEEIEDEQTVVKPKLKFIYIYIFSFFHFQYVQLLRTHLNSRRNNPAYYNDDYLLKL